MSHIQKEIVDELVHTTNILWYDIETERDKVVKYENKKRDLILRVLIHRRILSEDTSYIILNFINPILENISKFEFQLNTILDMKSCVLCTVCYSRIYNTIKKYMDIQSDVSWHYWRIRNKNVIFDHPMVSRPNFGLCN